MRITTWNVNGLRAAIRKGVEEVLSEIDPDILLLQEVRALPEQLPADWVEREGWHIHYHPAERKGYAGTAIWSREPLQNLAKGIGSDDPEGRVLRAQSGGVEVVSIYIPKGDTSEPEKQQAKLAWLDRFFEWTQSLVKKKRPIILGGDFNIAHTERDLYYSKANQKSSGFTPAEREWLGKLLKSGWHDVIREHYGEQEGPYTWWSNRGKAREEDRGWRIDYLLANPTAKKKLGPAVVDRELSLTVSDHAPVSVEIDV